MFKHLEVNVFPSVMYDLDINIRRDEAAALQQYFKLEVRYCGLSLPLGHDNKHPNPPAKPNTLDCTPNSLTTNEAGRSG